MEIKNPAQNPDKNLESQFDSGHISCQVSLKQKDGVLKYSQIDLDVIKPLLNYTIKGS